MSWVSQLTHTSQHQLCQLVTIANAANIITQASLVHLKASNLWCVCVKHHYNLSRQLCIIDDDIIWYNVNVTGMLWNFNNNNQKPYRWWQWLTLLYTQYTHQERPDGTHKWVSTGSPYILGCRRNCPTVVPKDTQRYPRISKDSF